MTEEKPKPKVTATGRMLRPEDQVPPMQQIKPKKPGAIVEDESVVGTQSGGVKTRQPDGTIDEGATDERENRRTKR